MNDVPEKKRLAEMNRMEIDAMLAAAHTRGLQQIPPGADMITIVFEGDVVWFATSSGESPLHYAVILKMVILRFKEIWGAIPTSISKLAAVCRGQG